MTEVDTKARAEALRAVIVEYFACVNGEDRERLADLWAADGELRAVGARPRVGRVAVMDYFAKIFDPWLHHHDEPTRIVVADGESTAVAEVTFHGTTHDGRQVRFDAVDVFDLLDGRIQRLTSWYDIDYVRRSLKPAA
ncbi:MAG: nuclear transport factor 2 family protein [Conexibacter sp.]|nr:nuclear transport factor 2 family protein [Conexibacter sp.]